MLACSSHTQLLRSLLHKWLQVSQITVFNYSSRPALMYYSQLKIARDAYFTVRDGFTPPPTTNINSTATKRLVQRYFSPRSNIHIVTYMQLDLPKCFTVDELAAQLAAHSRLLDSPLRLRMQRQGNYGKKLYKWFVWSFFTPVVVSQQASTSTVLRYRMRVYDKENAQQQNIQPRKELGNTKSNLHIYSLYST